MVLGFDNKHKFLEESTGAESIVNGVKLADYSGCDSYMEAALRCMQECDTNWNRFNDHLLKNEVNYFQENGVEIVYESEGIKKIVTNGVALIQSWLSKVLGVLHKFAVEMSAKVANMTKMIGLSKNDANVSKWPEGKSINDFDYNAAAKTVQGFSFIASQASGNLFAFQGNKEDFVKTGKHVESKLLKDGIKSWTGEEKTSCTVQEIKSHVLGEKKDITGNTEGYSYAAAKEVVTKFKAGISSVNKDAKDAKTVASNMIKSINAFGKEAFSSFDKKDKEGKNEFAGNVHSALSLVSAINSANNTLVTAKLSILVGQLALNKKIMAVYLKAAKKPGNEKPSVEGKETEKLTAKEESFSFGADFELV